MTFRKQTLSDNVEVTELPKHRWMNLFWGASTLGVAAGLTSGAAALLPLAGVALDPRIPTVTGAGAPIVAGAGLAMIIASAASLWWAKSRVQKPLRYLAESVENAASDGFHERLYLPAHGIGPQLSHAADHLQAITVSITDAGLDDGNQRLRVAFRGDAATRFEDIVASLKDVHQTILEREEERDTMHRKALAMTEAGAERLEHSASLHDAEQTRLGGAVETSQKGLAAIREQLAKLHKIDPAEIGHVVSGLRDQALAISETVSSNETARENVEATSAKLAAAGDEINASFAALKEELGNTASSARRTVAEREQMLVGAVDDVKATLVKLESSLTDAHGDVGKASDAVRKASDTVSTEAAKQTDILTESSADLAARGTALVADVHQDLKRSIGTLDRELGVSLTNTRTSLEGSVTALEGSVAKMGDELTATLGENRASLNEAISKVDREITSALRDSGETISDGMAKIDRLSDAADAAESRLGHMVETAEAALSENTASVRSSLASLTEQAADKLTVMIADADERLTGAVKGTGQAAIDVLREEIAPVSGAAADHAKFIRAATVQMREEAERITEAQQAASAVRSLSENAEAQLRGISEALGENAEKMAQATERAMHDVETRSAEANKRMDAINGQAEKSSKVLADTIEPLVGLVGKTRTMLNNMAEIEESQLAPSLRRIQSGLRDIGMRMDESDDEQLRRTGDIVRDQIRRSVSDLAGPVEQLLPSLTEQSTKFAMLEGHLAKIIERGDELPAEVVRKVGTYCADQLAAANAQMAAVESGLEKQMSGFTQAIDTIRTETPRQIEDAIGTLAEKLRVRDAKSVAGLESAFSVLQGSMEKQLTALSKAKGKSPSVDISALESAASNAVHSSIERLAHELKAKIEDIPAPSASQDNVASPGALPADEDKAQDAGLSAQIEQIYSLILAVEEEATAIAHSAISDPDFLTGSPEGAEALASAEKALASWTRQIENVSTAVAIAMDASEGQMAA